MRAWIRLSASLLLVSLAWACSGRVSYNLPARKYRRVYTGLENFVSNHAKSYRGRKAVLVTNQSGVDYQLQKNIDLLRKRASRSASYWRRSTASTGTRTSTTVACITPTRCSTR